MVEEALLRDIAGRGRQALELFGQIVSMESGTYDKPLVDKLGGFLAERLRALDFEVEIAPQAEVGDHVIGRRPGRNDKRVTLVGHFDTVFSAGTLTERPWRVEGDRCYGPGVYDMKGGIAILLTALEALRACRSPFFEECGCTVFFNSDEEILSPTSRPLIDAEAARSQTVCILEPARPGGEYTFVRKGAGKFWLRVHGRAAHAGGQPELGRSAVEEMAHKILKLHALTDLARGTTVNVGVVRAGERSNIICPEAYAEIDLRAVTPEERQRAESAMRRIAAEPTVPDTTGELTGDMNFPPLPRKPANEMLFQWLGEATRKVGFEAREVFSGGGSDGNHTGQIAPTIDGMGIEGNYAHTEREFGVPSSLVRRAQALALFLDAWPARAHLLPATV